MVNVLNKIRAAAKQVTIGYLFDLFDTGKLISISEFLQRELLKDAWYAKDYHNCKEYIASCFKTTNIFDSFSVVLLSKLMEVVNEKLQSETDDEKLEEYSKLYVELEQYQDAGVIYVSMDGQSRLMLAIFSYMTDKFKLNKCDKFINLEVDGKQSNCLQKSYFSKLPKEVQTYFENINVVLNIVEDFLEMDDVVEALVNKQKGFDWSWFQIIKQSKRYSLFTIRMIKAVNPKFKAKYKSCLKSLSKDLQYDVDGHQLFLVYMAYMYQNGTWPTKENVKSLFTDVVRLNDSSYVAVQKYAMEYFTELGKTKSTLSPLINYILLRQLIDNVKNGSKFIKEVNIGEIFIVKKINDFINNFIKLHHKLSNKKVKHEASFVEIKKGEWVLSKEGYAASCGKQDDENIFRRMKSFIEYFDIKPLYKNKVIEKVENTTMPSLIDVAVYNDFKDLNGNDVKISELPTMDRSHLESKDNTGSNELKNLVLEDYSSNRSRGEQNI
jgi:hypothetical protein